MTWHLIDMMCIVILMSADNEEKFPPELWELRQVATENAELERQWKIQRESLRALAVRAVLDDGFSVVRAADVAGVQRKSLSLWLEIERAVRKRTQS